MTPRDHTLRRDDVRVEKTKKRIALSVFVLIFASEGHCICFLLPGDEVLGSFLVKSRAAFATEAAQATKVIEKSN